MFKVPAQMLQLHDFATGDGDALSVDRASKR
jgi:hypothetical protein